ncbi:hypothetical protein M9Y10_019022 [Tritrichomonas musculus]|uniref:Uncharacterized protein n=1 Tax=Tritrichomonas musculus TaxID=1915356 RepID=A0ABR2HIC7_9EUKA
MNNSEDDFIDNEDQDYLLKSKSKFIKRSQKDIQNNQSWKSNTNQNRIKKKGKKKENKYMNYDESESDRQSIYDDNSIKDNDNMNHKSNKNKANNFNLNDKNFDYNDDNDNNDNDHLKNKHVHKNDDYEDNNQNFDNQFDNEIEIDDHSPRSKKSKRKRRSSVQKANDILPNSSEFADNSSPQSISNSDSYEQDNIDATLTDRHRNLQRFCEDYLTQLSDISDSLYNCADKSNNAKEIRAEAKKLSQLAQHDLFLEFSNETKKMNREIKHSKQMIDLISKSQSDRTNISNEILQKLSKDDLIFLIHNFFANNTDVKVPIELTIPKGTPNEFKELASKYKDASNYNEQANAEIQRMNIAIIQLRSENQRLKCQAASMAIEASLHNDLDDINERLSQLNKLANKSSKTAKNNRYDLTSSLEYNNKYHYENMSQKELTAEIQKQNQKKTTTKNELRKCDKFDLHMQIEMLKSENSEYQRVLLEKQKENEELQEGIKDLSKRIAKNETQETAKIAQQQQQEKLQQQQMLQQQQEKIMQQQSSDKSKKTTRKSNLSQSLRKKSPLQSSYSQKNFPRVSPSSRKESPTVRPPFYNYNNSKKI